MIVDCGFMEKITGHSDQQPCSSYATVNIERD